MVSGVDGDGRPREVAERDDRHPLASGVGVAPGREPVELFACDVQVTGLGAIESLVLVVPLMMVLGYVLQRGLLDRALGRGVLPPVLVTFGLAVILQNVLLQVYLIENRLVNHL